MLRRLKLSGAELVDRAMAKAIRFQVARTGQIPSWEQGLSRVAAVQEAYPREQLDDASFFPQPERPALRAQPIDSLVPGQRAFDWSWSSSFEPWSSEVRARYLSHQANRTAQARFYDAGPGAPVLIVQHGFLGGYWPLEERKFHVAAWLRRGYSVAIPLLPFHGLRASSLREPPPFPGHDLLLTVEGLRQTLFDFRALALHLRAHGAGALIGVGMSLGGYVTALWATLDPLDHLALFAPASSLAEAARQHGQLGPASEQLTPKLEQALAVVSPLWRTPQLTGKQVMVIAGIADRITPYSHAQRFAEHFSTELFEIPGGHLLQFGRARSLGVLHRRLIEQGLPGRPL